MARLRAAGAGALALSTSVVALSVLASSSAHAASGSVALSITGKELPTASPVTLLNYAGPNAFTTSNVVPIFGGFPRQQWANIDYLVNGSALPGVVRLGFEVAIDARYPLYVETQFSGAAAFGDTLNFVASQPGFLQLTMSFSGDTGGTSQFLNQTYPGWFPALPRNQFLTTYFTRTDASLIGSVIGQPASLRGDTRDVISDPAQTRGTGFGPMTVSIPFDAGPGATAFSILMTSGVQCRGTVTVRDVTFGGWNLPETFPGARGSVLCDAGRSLVWTGFSATTRDGQLHPSLRYVGSESGADYSRSFLAPPAVPAPGMMALFGLAALAVLRGRGRA